MIFLHPLLQFSMFLLAVYALVLGTARFRSLHLHQAVPFARSRHALAGGIALAGFLAGMAGGAFMTDLLDLDRYMGRVHGAGALAAIPFICFGIASGAWQYFKPRPRKVLPLLHAASNLITACLVVAQAVSGIFILKRALTGG